MVKVTSRFKSSRFSIPLQITLNYVVIGIIWILVSDYVLELLISNVSQLTFLQNLKGAAYVIITGVILYFLVKNYFQDIVKAMGKYEKLSHELEETVHERTLELQLNKVFNETVIDSLSEPVIVLDPDLRVKNMNRAAEDFFQVNDFKDKEFFKEIYKKSSGDLENEANLVLKTGREKIINTVYDAQGGNIICRLAKFNPLSKTPYLLLVINDISEIVKGHQEVHTLNKALIEKTVMQETAYKDLEFFTYSISHELRAPLTRISGYSKLLLDDYKNQDNNSEVIRLLKIIHENGKTMNKFLRDLLDFSRVSKYSLRKKEVNMGELARDVAEELNIERTEIEFGKIESCYGDFAMLRRVWYNLLSNAIKFRKAESLKIQIGSYRDKSNIVYFVQDNGLGIGEQHLKRIFHLFSRIHEYGDHEGSGVGLAIVEKVIYKHDGKIWAESAVGSGSRFSFSIPVLEIAQ